MMKNILTFGSLQKTLISALTLAGVVHAAPVMVSVGDAGNAGDIGGYGAVSYDYAIGKYEVTNAEYAQFLNAVAVTDTYGLYNVSMGSDANYGGISQMGVSGSFTYAAKAGMENKAVNYVSFWDAARYANWHTNGATGAASTETGVYMLTPQTILDNAVVRDTAAWNAGGYAVASEHEWYKAAYYKGGSTNAGYWLYATQSDVAPTASSTPNASANQANYNQTNGPEASLTPVGSFTGSASFYGTYDQNGSLAEWSDEVVFTSNRVVRDGTFYEGGNALQSSTRRTEDPVTENEHTGFRLSGLVAVPEPSTYGLCGAGAMVVLFGVRRRRRFAQSA